MGPPLRDCAPRTSTAVRVRLRRRLEQDRAQVLAWRSGWRVHVELLRPPTRSEGVDHRKRPSGRPPETCRLCWTTPDAFNGMHNAKSAPFTSALGVPEPVRRSAAVGV
jgi:hypothetical protein